MIYFHHDINRGLMPLFLIFGGMEGRGGYYYWYTTSKSSAVTLNVVFYVKQQEYVLCRVELQGYKTNCWSTLFSPINLNNLLTNQAISFKLCASPCN